MAQLRQSGLSKDWRSEDGQTKWLSTLVDAMERASRPEFRSLPCDPSVLIALGAQLARPASPFPYGGSSGRLLN
jgi:hypothetical protein